MHTHTHTASRSSSANHWNLGPGESASMHQQPLQRLTCSSLSHNSHSFCTHAQVTGRQYFDIVDNASEFTSVGVLLIVVGLFVMILGVIGVVGGIFATTVFGRITLGLVSVSMHGSICSMSVFTRMHICVHYGLLY